MRTPKYLLVVGWCLLALSCSSEAPTPFAIVPKVTTVPFLQAALFAVSGVRDSATIDWSVIEADGGSIDATGHYLAPLSGGTFHVLATSRADSSRQDVATIHVTVPESVNMTLTGQPIPRSHVSDDWGYQAPDGHRYGLMGTQKGILIADLEGPGAPRVIDEIAGPTVSDPDYHRDIKTFGHYAYASAEMTGTNAGVMVIDLSALPTQVAYLGSILPHDGEPRSHNLSIDTTRGLLYIQRDEPGITSGIEIWDLNADPVHPTYLTTFALGVHVHDMVGQGNRCYVANGTDLSYSIWDVSDPAQPVLLVTWADTGGYSHNIWPASDGSWVVTTEETAGRRVNFWSVSGDPVPVVTQRGSYLTGPNDLAHNAMVENGRVYISHYSSGVVVLDPSNLDAPAMVGQYDTSFRYPGGEFHGCWGVFAFPGSNLVLGSDIEQGLYELTLGN